MNTNALNGDPEHPRSVGGRPTVKTPETRKKVLDAIRKGAPRSVAAKAARISPQTLSAWVAEDPDLAAEIDQAESEVTARMVERLTGFAEAGDVSALRYLLEVREPTLFGSSRKGFASLPSPYAASLADTLARAESTRLKSLDIRSSPPTALEPAPPSLPESGPRKCPF